MPGNIIQSNWFWGESEQPLDLARYILRPWNHTGDSDIWAARERQRAGQPLSPPTYLLKRGRDALGEFVYSTAAQRYNLPSAVALWANRQDTMEVAIRFESEAWHPTNIDTLAGRASTTARDELLVNPLDWYRHLALSQALGDSDDNMECMVRQGILFRIDAASLGTLLAAFASRWAAQSVHKQREIELRRRNLQVALSALCERSPAEHQIYLTMLSQIAHDRGLAEHVAEATLRCPAIDLSLQHPPTTMLTGPSLFYTLAGWILHSPMLAEALSIYIYQSQLAIRQLLASHSLPEFPTG